MSGHMSNNSWAAQTGIKEWKMETDTKGDGTGEFQWGGEYDLNTL